jgi:heme a synthase
MSQNDAAPRTKPPTAPLAVFRLAALFTFLAVAMGAVVCATKSGASCPTWPGCRPDQITPGWQLSPVIEFSHRVVAMSAGPLVLAAAILSTRLPGRDRWLRILPCVALVGAIASGAFGRLVVLSSLPTWLGGVDLSCALIAMTVTGVAAIRAGSSAPGSPTDAATDGASNGASNGASEARRPGEPLSRLAAAGVLVLIAMHVTGIFAAGTGSYTRCMGWPLWRLVDNDLHPWLQGVRLGLAGLGAALVITTAVLAARREPLRAWGVALGALFVGEMAFGMLIRIHGLNDGVAATYSVLAVALLSCLGLLGATAHAVGAESDGVPPGTAATRGELAEPAGR